MSPVFRHGSLRLYLLRLLDEEPRHGYEVIRLLRDRFMGVYSPSPGTIYPRLARLEEEGLVTHDEVDGRKVYRITEAGRDELRSRSDELDELEEELSASVNDIVREVREDVRQTVRSLREELTWAARESRRTGRETSAEAREQARQARDEAREQAKQTRDETLEQAKQARDEALEQAKQARAEVKELARQAREQAREQARRTPGPAQAGRENPWEQATDETEAGQPAGTPGQDAAQRVREHARWLREEAQRVREESPEPTGAGGYRDRIRDEAAARFTGGEQDWDSAGWAGRPGWTDWPGQAGLGRLGQDARRPAQLERGTGLRDLEGSGADGCPVQHRLAEAGHGLDRQRRERHHRPAGHPGRSAGAGQDRDLPLRARDGRRTGQH